MSFAFSPRSPGGKSANKRARYERTLLDDTLAVDEDASADEETGVEGGPAGGGGADTDKTTVVTALPARAPTPGRAAFGSLAGGGKRAARVQAPAPVAAQVAQPGFRPDVSIDVARDAVQQSSNNVLAVMTPSKADAVVTFVYLPGASFPPLTEYLGQVVEVRVAAPYLTSKLKEIETRELWGTQIYTDDSDPVAIIMHSGSYALAAEAPTDLVGINVFFKILPGQARYEASEQHGFRSRAWAAPYDRCSLRLVRSERMVEGHLFSPRAKKEGDKTEVIQMLHGRRNPTGVAKRGTRKFIPHVVLLFGTREGLETGVTDPRLKYSLGLIADRGMTPESWTSTRLRTETLYFEEADTHETFELSWIRPTKKRTQAKYDTYRWATLKVQEGNARKRARGANGPVRHVPRATATVSVIHDQLDWDELEWGVGTVLIRGKEYALKSMVFVPNSSV